MEYLTWDCGGKLRVPDAKEIECPKHISSFVYDFTLVCISNNNTAVCMHGGLPAPFPRFKDVCPKVLIDTNWLGHVR